MVPSATDAWRTALGDLRETLPERTVQNWLDPIQALELNTDEGAPTLTLEVPTPFGVQYLRSRFQRSIRQAVTDAVGEPTEVSYRVAPESQSSESEESEEGDRPSSAAEDSDASSSRSVDRSSTAGQTTQSASRPQSAQAPKQSTSTKTSPRTRARRSENVQSDRTSSRDRSTEQQPKRKNGADPQTQSSRSARSTQKEISYPQQANEGSADERSALYKDAQQHLRPEYTFDEFIEGDGNRLARSAAFAVAQEPGATNYNPLLVYGGVGLGKTHLAQAVANYALEHSTAQRVLYVSSDRFTSQFVQSVRENRIAAFSSYYRQADLLIVDDVQFFGEKEKTQEEFFHIFNDLHQNGKQLFLCADRPPAEIPGIEERLLSRFQWGLSADIQRPDLETRIAILQRKAARQDITVEPDVLELIAQRIDSNVRQLEGALTRLTALVQLDDRTLDLDTARRYLREHTDENATVLDAAEIIEQVADYFRLDKKDLLSRSRKQAIAEARQIAMYLCRELTDESYSSIGSRFGGRDHSTVIHAYRKIDDAVNSDEDLQDDISSLHSRLRNRSLSSNL